MTYMEGSIDKGNGIPESVAVTGMGVISAIGNNLKEYSQSLRTGKSGIGYIESPSEPSITINIGAEIEDFSFESNV